MEITPHSGLLFFTKVKPTRDFIAHLVVQPTHKEMMSYGDLTLTFSWLDITLFLKSNFDRICYGNYLKLN